MTRKTVRLIGLVGVGIIGLWWARLAAHAKLPPPEGRWREIDETDLRG